MDMKRILTISLSFIVLLSVTARAEFESCLLGEAALRAHPDREDREPRLEPGAALEGQLEVVVGRIEAFDGITEHDFDAMADQFGGQWFGHFGSAASFGGADP